MSDEALAKASTEMYELHGRAVSYAADAEFRIRVIALAYGSEDFRSVRRCWDDAVKPILRDRGLTPSLQPQLERIAQLFDARNPLAHRPVFFAKASGGSFRIMQYWVSDGAWHTGQIGFEDLRAQVERALSGRDAARTVFEAVCDDNPALLDSVPKEFHGFPWRF